MKKLLLLFLIICLSAIALAPRNRATSNADLTCDFDKYWQRDIAGYSVDAYGHSVGTYDTKVDIKVITYDKYAKVTTGNITTVFEKVQETKSSGEFGYITLTYKGNFPGSERTALLSVYADITNRHILQYDIVFTGIKAGKNTVSHSCYPVKEEYRGKSWSCAVPFHHNYKMPTETEKCINTIVDKVLCNNEQCNSLSLVDKKTKELSQQEALSLSKNWNYSNMKYYRNDGKLEAHEKDACEVVDRINKFIYDNDLDNHKYKALDQAITDVCGFDCKPGIATGELGDFLVMVPETEELRKIASSEKNAKFLSVFNPNSYAKAGYCLINIIPYSTWEKIGMPDNDCGYRIYCGAPEFMNYDEFYAVEVCH